MDTSIMLWVWLGVIVIASIFEFVSMQMVTVWFVPAGLIALILHFCGVGWEIQIIVFIVVALILLLSLRKICLKYLLKNNHSEIEINSLVGKEAVLITPITEDEKGSVKISDVVWTAITEPHEDLPAGTNVEIAEVRGNKLVVRKIVKK